jgi:transcription initiation factor IIF auxiliary subunit
MYQIKSEWDSTVETKQFTGGGNYHFYVRIYIDANPEELDNIQLVKYTLHPTFTDPVRISESRSTNFDIRIWTYGYFDLTALLIKKDGTTEDVPGYVRWEIPAGSVPINVASASGASVTTEASAAVSAAVSGETPTAAASDASAATTDNTPAAAPNDASPVVSSEPPSATPTDASADN